ncbi:MAG: hypothetical protein ACFFCF_11415 [Promethearchaeota archaeon]
MTQFLHGNRVKPEQIPYLVTFFAREYVPKIKTFLETEYPTRQEGAERFTTLMREIYPQVYQLQNQLPESLAAEMLLELPAYISLHEWEKEPQNWTNGKKKALKAFLDGKETPADDYGNPDFLSGMFVSLMMLLNSTYKGLISLRGLYSNFEDPVYTDSYFRSVYRQFEDEIFAKGRLKTLGDLRGIMPLIYEIERKLALFPPTKELEHM